MGRMGHMGHMGHIGQRHARPQTVTSQHDVRGALLAQRLHMPPDLRHHLGHRAVQFPHHAALPRPGHVGFQHDGAARFERVHQFAAKEAWPATLAMHHQYAIAFEGFRLGMRSGEAEGQRQRQRERGKNRSAYLANEHGLHRWSSCAPLSGKEQDTVQVQWPGGRLIQRLHDNESRPEVVGQADHEWCVVER